MTGEWWWRHQLYYINVKLSMERSDAMMSLSRRTYKSIYTFNSDKKKRKGNVRRSSSSFFTLIFQFTSHKHTPGEFNHILAKIQLCVMTSSAAMNWSVALLSYKLILLNRHANTSQEERLGPSLFRSLIIYVYIKVKWAILSSFFSF